MNKLLSGLFISLTLLFFACEKEKSFETTSSPAKGSLQGDGTGLCLPKSVNGSYVANKSLGVANTMDVTVNVGQAGSYVIYTDTVNGYYFRTAGTFTATGIQTVNLKGTGTPLTQGTNVFTVFFDSSQCDIAVQVLPSGAGGPAAFTLAGAGGGCTTPSISGNYVIGTALNATNTVILTVNVTTAGTYSVTTSPVQGMTFSGSGVLAATGAQTITLTGSGTPVAPAGTVAIPVTAGGGTCNFNINLVATPPAAADYYPRTVGSNWTYEANDVANDSLLRVASQYSTTAYGNTFNTFAYTLNASSGYDSTGYFAGYFRNNNTDYYRYNDMADYLGFDSSAFAEFIFIKDTAALATWYTNGFSGKFGGTAATIRIKYKILERDVSKTITTSLGAATYPNVIVVEERYEAYISGSWQDITTSFGYYKDYYAKNIGWIYHETYNGTGSMVLKLEMRRYKVN